MKVLIAVDDSAYSRAAMDWVERVSWPADTVFLVVSAARPVMAAYALADAGGSFSGSLFEDETKRHEEIAARYERKVKECGYPSAAIVEQGDPRDVIVRLAKERGADLIVVGSHGRSGISKLILGSVANHVVTHAPCSVMVVKQPRGADARMAS